MMVRLARLSIIFVLLVSYTSSTVHEEQHGDEQHDITNRDDKRSLTNSRRGLTSQRRGFLDGGFPVHRYRRKSSQRGSYYRATGKGKGGGGSKVGKSKKGKSKKAKHDYDFLDEYTLLANDCDDDVYSLYGFGYQNNNYCIPYTGTWRGSHSSSSSSSDSNDHVRGRARERQLRGNGRNLKSKRSRGKGKGKGYSGYGRGRGGGGDRPGGYKPVGYGPGDQFGNDYGYGFEYGPDGYLRPRCPPGYLYYDQLAEVEGPERPGFGSQTEGETSMPTPTANLKTSAPSGPVPPDTPAPDTPAPETPAPETPAPETPAPETPAPETPAPETAAPTPALVETAAPETAAPTSAPADTTPPTTASLETTPPTTASLETTPPTTASLETTPPTKASPAPSSFSTSADPLRVVVEDSFLDYGFFDGVTAREPTEEELAGLYEQTNLFFTEVFRNMYGADFVSFEAANNVPTFTGADNTYPVRIDFDAVVQFAEGSTPPTRDEVFTAMQNSDLNNYIQSFVWNATPSMTSLFYDTQRVRYDAKISSTGTGR